LRPESEAEEALVRSVGAELGLPVSCFKWSEPRTGVGMQDAARAWRRSVSEAALDGVLREREGAGHIATAHHADDQVETVVMKLLRGAHLSHLWGMDARRGPYIKPLLPVRKEDLVSFLTSRRLPWLEDASNASDKYKRNKVRLRLVPLLNELAGGEEALRSRFEELASQSQELEAWIAAEVEAWERGWAGGGFAARELPLQGWGRLPRLVQQEALHRFVRKGSGGVVLPFAQISRVLDHVGRGRLQWRLDVAERWAVERSGEVLRLMRLGGEVDRPSQGAGDEVEMPGAGVTFVANSWASRVEAVRGVGEGAVLYNVPVGTVLEVRSRIEGDRFHPPWRDGPVKVKDFLRGQKVPLHRRDDVPLICSGSDILCVWPDHVAKPWAEDASGIPPLTVRVLSREDGDDPV
jgi:tRNA(Ile)-lysidine synthase